MTRQVPLSRGHFAIVDDDDYDRVIASGPWHVRPSGSTFYARHSITASRGIDMHGMLTGWPYVDHINGDGLDNRRTNLRAASVSQNLANRGPQRNNTSGYKGVTLRRNGRMVAQIKVCGHQMNIGTFDTVEDAARAYDAAALTAWGEFAYLNFPKEHAS